MRHPTNPLPVYTPVPMQQGPYGPLSGPQSPQTAPVVIVQQMAAPEPSWLREHSGQLVAGAGAGIIAIGLLLAVAVVAVAVAVGAVSVAGAWLVLKRWDGAQTKK